MTRYRTIVADPPWDLKGGPLIGGVGEGFQFDGPERSRDLPYSVLSVDALKAMPVADLADTDCALYLWTVNAYVPAAYEVARAWGFKPSTLLVWAKNPMGGGPWWRR